MKKDEATSWSVDPEILSDERKEQLRELLSPFGGTLTPMHVLNITAEHEHEEAVEILRPLINKHSEKLYENQKTIADNLGNLDTFQGLEDVEIVYEIANFPIVYAKLCAPQNPTEDAYVDGLQDADPSILAERAIDFAEDLTKEVLAGKKEKKRLRDQLKMYKHLDITLDLLDKSRTAEEELRDMPKPSRGRPKISRTEKQLAIDRWHRWVEARTDGIPQARFCEDEDCTARELDKGRGYLREGRN